MIKIQNLSSEVNSSTPPGMKARASLRPEPSIELRP